MTYLALYGRLLQTLTAPFKPDVSAELMLPYAGSWVRPDLVSSARKSPMMRRPVTLASEPPMLRRRHAASLCKLRIQPLLPCHLLLLRCGAERIRIPACQKRTRPSIVIRDTPTYERCRAVPVWNAPVLMRGQLVNCHSAEMEPIPHVLELLSSPLQIGVTLGGRDSPSQQTPSRQSISEAKWSEPEYSFPLFCR